MNKNVVLIFCYFKFPLNYILLSTSIVHLFLYMCLKTWVTLHQSESITFLINVKENTDYFNHKNT